MTEYVALSLDNMKGSQKVGNIWNEQTYSPFFSLIKQEVIFSFKYEKIEKLLTVQKKNKTSK